MAHFAEY